ncbi:hypothetical protein FRC20_009992 [Serendipita sp. 405]|nr:hypothetical protein FRC20_009992 [Serendipita sp. 405]
MPNRGYAPIPSPQEAAEDAERQMEDAFDISDDEGDHQDHDHDDSSAETQPMIPAAARSPTSPTTDHHHNTDRSTYNFEYDYTMPPPGNPPPPSALAYEDNVFGNSNGILASSSNVARPNTRGGWLQRNLGSLGLVPARWTGRAADRGRPIGGGTNNDGVFANVSAKPTTTNSRPNGIGDLNSAEQGGSSSGAHIVPEFAQKDTPPSYAEAQMDAVPPYWDTTVLAPAGAGDELIVEGLPPGHVFAFVTSFFISFSFQFIGFMLTSIMATTHAGKFGSRAGLGITLVQFGLYLRGNGRDLAAASNNVNGWPSGVDPHPTFSSAQEADDYYANKTIEPTPTPPDFPEVPSLSSGDYALPSEVTLAADWLSFFLMTVGWLLFLTSLLGFWRVKRWERSLRMSSSSGSNSGSMLRVIPPEVERPTFTALRDGVSRDFRRIFARMPHETEQFLPNSNSRERRGHSDELPPQHPLSRSPEPPMDPETRRRYEAAVQIDRQIETELRRAGLL